MKEQLAKRLAEQRIEHHVQGDVLVERVDTLPAGAVKRTPSVASRTLALGETSGHGHIVTAGVEVYDAPDGTMYVEVPEGAADAALEHLLVKTGMWTGEHNPVALTPGTYRVVLQNQYNPYERAIERVAD